MNEKDERERDIAWSHFMHHFCQHRPSIRVVNGNTVREIVCVLVKCEKAREKER